jgi:hypothetical protein
LEDDPGSHRKPEFRWTDRGLHAFGDESPLLPLPRPLSPPLPSFTVPLFFANDICTVGIEKSVTTTLADINENVIVSTKSVTTKPLLLVILVIAYPWLAYYISSQTGYDCHSYSRLI